MFAAMHPGVIGKRELTGVACKRGRRLLAAMQHNDQRSRRSQARGHVAQHTQITRVRSEPGLLAANSNFGSAGLGSMAAAATGTSTHASPHAAASTSGWAFAWGPQACG